LSADDVTTGTRPTGPVVVFDDEGYVIASAIAAMLATEGFDVTFVCTSGQVAPWTNFTEEQHCIQKRLLESGSKLLVSHQVTALTHDMAEATCLYTGRTTLLPCGGFIPVTSREPDDVLWRAISAMDQNRWRSVIRLGDCKAPGFIATAIHDGHRAARELTGTPPARRERT
jgi:dimethylamine/trimethylamine dehydrogenase